MEENPPQPCPNGTYNGEKGADDIGYCLDCPGGYICVGEGIANYTTEPCPIGFYCINASTEAEPCPPGTYRWVTNKKKDAPLSNAYKIFL